MLFSVFETIEPCSKMSVLRLGLYSCGWRHCVIRKIGSNLKNVTIVTTWKSDVHHLPPMCHVYIRDRIKFLLSYLLKLSCIILFFVISSASVLFPMLCFLRPL